MAWLRARATGEQGDVERVVKAVRTLDDTVDALGRRLRAVEQAVEDVGREVRAIKGIALTSTRSRDPELALAKAEASKWKRIAEEALGGEVHDLGPAGDAPPAQEPKTIKEGPFARRS